MSVDIVPLCKADIPGAVECIQQSFADDPFFIWAFDDPSKFNKERNQASLTARCLWGIENALFYVAKESSSDKSGSSSSSPPSSSSQGQNILGVSCWLPPHPPSEPQSWHAWYQDKLLSLRQLLNLVWYWGRGGLNVERYRLWKEQQNLAHSEIWTDPRGYYFCNIVAVRPHAQGRGIGRKLFDTVTRFADNEGVKCYLESSKNIPNVQIYEKIGFEMVKVINCTEGNDSCTLYCMVREPVQKH